MQSVSPVFTENEVKLEINIAEDQVVIGLPVSLQIVNPDTRQIGIVSPWGMAIRFRLSDDERAAIAAGKDLVLTQLNSGKPVTPMNIQFCAIDEIPFFGDSASLNVPLLADPNQLPRAFDGDDHFGGPQLVEEN